MPYRTFFVRCDPSNVLLTDAINELSQEDRLDYGNWDYSRACSKTCIVSIQNDTTWDRLYDVSYPSRANNVAKIIRRPGEQPATSKLECPQRRPHTGRVGLPGRHPCPAPDHVHLERAQVEHPVHCQGTRFLLQDRLQKGEGRRRGEVFVAPETDSASRGRTRRHHWYRRRRGQ